MSTDQHPTVPRSAKPLTSLRALALTPLLAVVVVCAQAGASHAAVATIKDETPAVSVDIPAPFETSKTSRGIQAKTPDGEVYVWFETYDPAELDTLIKEHDDYWTKSEVEPGDKTDKFTKQVGDKSVSATDFKGATWKGKPTVVRYLSIDAALPSKRMVLMSLWASPDGDKAHDAQVMDMIGSLKIQE